MAESMKNRSLFVFNTSQTNGLSNKTLTEINNLATGIYAMFEGNAEVSNLGLNWGTLIVFNGYYQKMQIFISHPQARVRTSDGNTWSGWSLLF